MNAITRNHGASGGRTPHAGSASRAIRAAIRPMLVLPLLSGCTGLATQGSLSYALFATPILLEQNRQLYIPRERMSRYVCATGQAMVCECQSRLSYDCECGC